MTKAELKAVAPIRTWEAWRSLRDKAWNKDYRYKITRCLNYQRANAGLPPYKEPDLPIEEIVAIHDKVVAYLESESNHPKKISEILYEVARQDKILHLHISIVVGKMVDAGELIAEMQGSFDIASSRQPTVDFVLTKDTLKKDTFKKDALKKVATNEVAITVSEGVFTPSDPLGVLDDLVTNLLDSGKEIHKRSWFKELQIKHPLDIKNPPMQDVLEYLKDNDQWQTLDQIIDSFLKRGVPIVSEDSFAHIVNRLVKTDKIESKQQAGQHLYRVRPPAPRTDEDSILEILSVKPDDWVNTAWLAKSLHVPADDQDLVCLLSGKLLELTSAKKVKLDFKKGDSHWQIANNL